MANFRNIVISSSGTGGTLVWPTGTLAMGGLVLTGAGAINGITLSGTTASLTLATNAAATLTGPVQLTFSGFGTLETSISVGKTITLSSADNYTLTATASGNVVVQGGALGTPSSGVLSNCTAATTSAAGVVELATQAETEAGSDTGRVPTVATVLAANVNHDVFGMGGLRIVSVAYSYASSGAGSSAALSSNGLSVSSGTANAGYGIARFQRDITTFPSSTGSGITFSKAMAVSLTLTGMSGSANAAIRVIVGESDSSAPAAADVNALAAHGFGCEFRLNGATISDVRLFAHNGTTYVTSSYAGLACMAVVDPPSIWTRMIISSDAAGTISLYLSSLTLQAARPSTTPILTLAGGPTGMTGANRTVAIACVNATGAAAAQTGTDRCVARVLFPVVMTLGTGG